MAEINIGRCFPELDEDQIRSLAKHNFRSLARTLFEIGWSWGASARRMHRVSLVDGQEHLEEAARSGKGVLLVTAHMTCLEIGGRAVCALAPVAGIYRPLHNEALEWYQNRGRLAYASGMISKRDMRSAIRHLRNGGTIWYAPDQDFGPDQSLFAPFFGIRTATLEATHKLARATGCMIVPMFPRYEPGSKRYVTTVLPPMSDFAEQDAAAALEKLNSVMEAQIREVPDQYWWIHRRFKTRPYGEASFYD